MIRLEVKKKLSSLEAWKFGGITRQLLQNFVGLDNYDMYRRNFTCSDFINLLSCQTAELPNFRKHNCKALALAFTMAEILISLTIIGIIAAITLPALQANINESAWRAQRKALYSRMSQAISMLPSLNGYGEYEGTWAEGDVVTVTKDTAAQTFVTNGLSKVLEIKNICTADKLKDCGIPDKITVMGANSKINFPTNLTELNPMFTSTLVDDVNNKSYKQPQRNINTNAAAFETKNGESVAVFYNPYCVSFDVKVHPFMTYSQPWMCANFIYDLNGRKGPNKMGKDIGFITALYPTDTEIVAPMPLEEDLKPNGNYPYFNPTGIAGKDYCKDLDGRIPNLQEFSSMFYNKRLITTGGDNIQYYVKNTDGNYYYFYQKSGHVLKTDNPYGRVRCVKR